MENHTGFRRSMFLKSYAPQVCGGKSRKAKRKCKRKTFTKIDSFEKNSTKADVSSLDCTKSIIKMTDNPNDSSLIGLKPVHVRCPQSNSLKVHNNKKGCVESVRGTSMHSSKTYNVKKKNVRKPPKVERDIDTNIPDNFSRIHKLSNAKQKSQKYSYKVKQRLVVCKMRPRHISFTRGRFTSKFAGINKTIYDTLDELKSRTMSIEDIPKITVFRRNGKTYTMNNRRLWVFEALSTHYREVYRKDLLISVLFREKLNLIKVSRTVGSASPATIIRMKTKEKKSSINHAMQKFYVRSKSGHGQNTIPSGQSRMQKADIRRLRNGDDDFKLFSMSQTATDLGNNDSENIHDQSAYRKSTRRLPELGEYIEKFIGDKLRQLQDGVQDVNQSTRNKNKGGKCFDKKKAMKPVAPREKKARENKSVNPGKSKGDKEKAMKPVKSREKKARENKSVNSGKAKGHKVKAVKQLGESREKEARENESVNAGKAKGHKVKPVKLGESREKEARENESVNSGKAKGHKVKAVKLGESHEKEARENESVNSGTAKAHIAGTNAKQVKTLNKTKTKQDKSKQTEVQQPRLECLACGKSFIFSHFCEEAERVLKGNMYTTSQY